MRNRPATLYLAASVLVFLAALSALPAGAGSVAKIENDGRALVFSPAVEAKAMTLTISGPCEYRSVSTVERGELAFKLDRETPDGRYRFSLVATPALDRELRSALLRARETGDNRAVTRLCRERGLPDPDSMIQSGSFMVLEGKIIFDQTPESERKTDSDKGE